MYPNQLRWPPHISQLRPLVRDKPVALTESANGTEASSLMIGRKMSRTSGMRGGVGKTRIVSGTTEAVGAGMQRGMAGGRRKRIGTGMVITPGMASITGIALAVRKGQMARQTGRMTEEQRPETALQTMAGTCCLHPFVAVTVASRCQLQLCALWHDVVLLAPS